MIKIMFATLLLIFSGSASFANPFTHCTNVKIIHPFGTGASSDIISRIIADYFSKEFDVPFIVETKPGGSPPGLLAGQALLGAAPDGCTLGMINEGSYAFNTLPYPLTDETFTFIAPTGKFREPLLLLPGNGVKIVHNNQTYEFKDLKSLIEFGKKNPDVINYAAPAPMATFCMNRFIEVTGLKMVKIPFKSEPEALLALKQNNIHLVCSFPIASRGLINSGDLVIGASTLNNKDEDFPSAPTLPGVGVKNFRPDDFPSATLLVGPKGLDKNIATLLNSKLCEMMQKKEIIEKYKSIHIIPQCFTLEEMKNYVGKRIKLFENVKF